MMARKVATGTTTMKNLMEASPNSVKHGLARGQPSGRGVTEEARETCCS